MCWKTKLSFFFQIFFFQILLSEKPISQILGMKSRDDINEPDLPVETQEDRGPVIRGRGANVEEPHPFDQNDEGNEQEPHPFNQNDEGNEQEPNGDRGPDQHAETGFLKNIDWSTVSIVIAVVALVIFRVRLPFF